MSPAAAQAIATVTSCTYDVGAGQALAFGIPRNKHFRIGFNYWANGELRTGEYASKAAVPQGTLFPITYEPDAPHIPSQLTPSNRSQILLVGIAGSVILSVVWMVILRGCR